MKREAALDAIAALIHRVEPGLAENRIRSVVATLAPLRPLVPRLLPILQKDIELLTSGSDKMPSNLGRIIRQLLQDGATTLKSPRCYRCHEERQLPNRIGDHGICDTCYSRSRVARIECSCCKQWRQRRALVAGREWCGSCWDIQLAAVADLLRTAILGSGTGVTASQLEAVETTLHRTLKAGDILRMTMELDVHAAEWFANPAAGSALFLKLHDALGETGVVLNPLVCGRCGRESRLVNILEGLRCCGKCYRESKRKTCSQCGRDQILVLHDDHGSGICQTCMKKMPERLAVCVGCQQRRYVAWNGPDGPVCSICRPKQLIDCCSRCNRRKPCLFAGTSKARCHECSKRRECCSLCGKDGRVYGRDGAGAAICQNCGGAEKSVVAAAG